MKPHFKYNWKTKEWEKVIVLRFDSLLPDYNDYILHPDSGLTVNAHRAIFGEDK